MRLTRDEILLIVGILLILVTGALAKHYRATHRVTIPSPNPVSEKAAPDP